MSAVALTVFVSSLLGSLHCAGMCGGFVAMYSGDATLDSAGRRWLGHASYSLGRLAAYATLGAAAGALGSAVDLAGSWVGVERFAALIAGLLIVAWGLHGFLVARGVRLRPLPAPAFLRRATAKGAAMLRDRPPVVRALLLGSLSACLPCGWLYAFVVTAGGTGSALEGALLMGVFWTGTLPVMLALGEAVRVLAGPLRRHVPAACAVVLMVVGLAAVFGRASLISASTPHGEPPACHGRP